MTRSAPYEEALEARLRHLLWRSRHRTQAMEVVAGLGLPDCWIAGGFARSLVWDAQHAARPDHVRHHYDASPLTCDVDVCYFDSSADDKRIDRCYELHLSDLLPEIDWSVKNQVRMHVRNNDAPYRSTHDAVAAGPETSVIAVRRVGAEIEVMAPHGLADLFGLVLRPVPGARPDTLDVMRDRVENKGWLERWPGLSVEGLDV